MVSGVVFGFANAVRFVVGAAFVMQMSVSSVSVVQDTVFDNVSFFADLSDKTLKDGMLPSEPVVNDPELEKLAETAKFSAVPEYLKIDDKTYSVTSGSIAVGDIDNSYGETERLSRFMEEKRVVRDGLVTDGDNVLVTVPQHLVVSGTNTCPYIGERLLLKTKSGKLSTARIGGFFDYDKEVTDKDKSVYVTLANDKAMCLDVWSEDGNTNPFVNDAIVGIANLGLDDVWTGFDIKESFVDNTVGTAEDYVGKWNASKGLREDKWLYKTDVVLGKDGDSADKVESLGIVVGDVLANGTNADAPARVYLGDDGEGHARWQRADKDGKVWDIETWDDDMVRRSVWRLNNVVKTNGTSRFTGTGAFASNGSISAGTKLFIESCKKEADDWASGANASQPWKYVDYWKSKVSPEQAASDWGGQCSEYVLWNLANIGLVPGKTMASLDTIQWGARCEIKFLQEHPEYGEIHALDGGEDGCIPGYYVPRPGDIAVHNHGDHFEMVSEVYDDHWEGYSSGGEGAGAVSHPIDKNSDATNHDGYYVFLTIYFDKALADS